MIDAELPDPVRQEKTNAFVQFFAHSALMTHESEKAGKPVHKKIDFVRIQFPGERDNVERKATAEDKLRYPAQWRAYEQGQEQVPDGVPLAVLFPADPQIVDNLRAQFRLHTVEQLAAVSDTACQSMGLGAMEYRVRAQKFLAAASAGVPLHQWQAESTAMKEEIADLKLRLDAAMKALEAATAEKEAQKPKGKPS